MTGLHCSACQQIKASHRSCRCMSASGVRYALSLESWRHPCLQVYGTASSRPAALDAALQQVAGLTELLKAEVSSLAAQGKASHHAMHHTQGLDSKHLSLACMIANILAALASCKISATFAIEVLAQRQSGHTRLKTPLGSLPFC